MTKMIMAVEMSCSFIFRLVRFIIILLWVNSIDENRCTDYFCDRMMLQEYLIDVTWLRLPVSFLQDK